MSPYGLEGRDLKTTVNSMLIIDQQNVDSMQCM